MWRTRRFVVLCVILSAAVVAVSLILRQYWSPEFQSAAGNVGPAARSQEAAQVLELSKEAQQNLGLSVKPLKLQTYWRTVQMPGVIVDRPGKSDRGMTSPAVAVVAEIHAYPGDTVHPGDRLFTLRVFSEYLQNTQTELFRATRETEVIRDQIDRLKTLVESGAIPTARIIELENQQRRQNAAISAYRQDLLTRGLSVDQVDQVTEGNFASSINVVAPPPVVDPPATLGSEPTTAAITRQPFKGIAYEVQELKAELGQQVQAGQLLCVLGNHSMLYIEGHAFKQEAPALERAAQNKWPIEVEFAEDDATGWPKIDQRFVIHHLASTVDPATRTFNFFIPLANQSRGYDEDGHTFVVWRFRPGQRVRLHVPVEELQGVFVLPTAAVVREGPEAFVFRQNGNLFNRKPVHVLHEDRRYVVLANDGQITPGLYIAQNAGASMNRVLKSQSASGTPVGVHVHADGTVHGAH